MDKKSKIDDIYQCFHTIKQNRQDVYYVSYFQFATMDVSIEVIGDELAQQIYRPFQHLKVDNSGKSVLKIFLWDESFASGKIENFSIGKTWEAHDGTFSISEDNHCVAFAYNGSTLLLDLEEEIIIGFRKSGSALSRYEISKPFLVLFSVWYHKHNIQLLHAGLLCYNNKGILFPGSGGSGKSTSTLSCTLAGFQYLADDFMGLEVQKNKLIGYSVYCSAAIVTDHLKNFPSLEEFATKDYLPIEDKSSLFLAEIPFCKTAKTTSIDYIVMPKITHQKKSRLVKATAVEALMRLAPSSMFFVLPRPGKEAFDKMSKLVEKVPAYWLEFGYDIEEVPNLIKEFIDEK